jgi:SAM-dependent methyltransferase
MVISEAGKEDGTPTPTGVAVHPSHVRSAVLISDPRVLARSVESDLDPSAQSAPIPDHQRRIESIIHAALESLKRAHPASAAPALMARVVQNVPVDHQRDWRDFTLAYLVTNYRKSLATLRLLPEMPFTSVLDAGCGAGAATLALLTVAFERHIEPKRLVLLDRIQAPLAFAEQLVGSVANHLEIECEISLVCQDIFEYEPSRPEALVVCSHLLGEHDHRQAAQLWARLVDALPDNGVAVAIERANERPWRDFQKVLSQQRVESRNGEVSVVAPAPAMTDAVRSWETAWYISRKPPAWITTLINGYFRAWEQQDALALSSLFTHDAVYQDKPFRTAVHGLAGITAYWQAHVLPQKSPAVTVMNVSYGLLSGTIQWRASFVDAKGFREVEGIMVMEVDPQEQRICRLAEIFRTRTTAGRSSRGL